MIVLASTAACTLRAAEPIALTIDCAKGVGPIRALHGVNGGTQCAGDTVDLSPRWREAHIPWARLHDCHWPNADVVDIHVLFPKIDADPDDPASYDFRRTDDYLASLTATGAGVVFRLGESIEHTRRKYHVNPPADVTKWAAICQGIARHYNGGWAGGFHDKVRYWEIWNEPENRPAMWTGDDADFLDLYTAAAKAVKQADPRSRVGGCGFGYVGELEGERLRPTPFVAAFLRRCREESLPLDFFSWHRYTSDPRELVALAKGVRRMLDESGFPRAENHLNEWSFLPDGKWGPILDGDPIARTKWFERLGGPEGAAFAAATLIALQDAPVDLANYYSADTQGFGLFNEHGAPKKAWYALRAFGQVAALPKRLSVKFGDDSTAKKLYAAATASEAGDRVLVLIANTGTEDIALSIALQNGAIGQHTKCVARMVDADHDFGDEKKIESIEGRYRWTAPAHSVTLLEASAAR